MEAIDCNFNDENEHTSVEDTIDSNTLSALLNSNSNKYKIGKMRLYKITENSESKVVPVHIAQHYLYRGEYLKDLSVYDYMTLIDLEQKKLWESENCCD